MTRGIFITLEGGEGAGKTTQIALLRDALTAAGRTVLTTREPGGTTEGAALRRLLVEGDAAWTPWAETLLFYADRMQHVERMIQPALQRGEIVICDRFADSTMVYQGIGKGLSAEYIRALHAFTLGNLMPDATFILDISPEAGLARTKGRAGAEDRFEGMDLSFHHQVRSGFLAIAKRETARCRVVDASQAPEAVFGQIWGEIARFS